MEKIVTCDVTEDFIQRLADCVEKEFLLQGKDISRLAFVFGGRRPALFLKKELAGRIGKSFFSPRFFSIDEFVEYLLAKKAPFSKISDLEACFTIYTLAGKIAADIVKGKDTFSRFLPWAKEILYFIEQMDLEDIRLESLENIQEKASIGYDVPENINRMLESIIAIRQAYHTALEEKKSYPRGLMYLLASQYAPQVPLSEFEHIFFCGFFYLHKTEQEIIKHFYEGNKATLFFQGDASDWSVLEKLSVELSHQIKPAATHTPKFCLSIQSGFDVHSEVCLVREILKKRQKLDSTVIVLPQAETIIPLLSEIASYADDFNVSMGYPLKRSSLYSLFEGIFQAQETKKDNEYYSRDYLKALAHPLVKNLKILPSPSITRVLVHKIEEILTGMEHTSLGGSLFIRLSDIQDSRELFDLAMITMKTMDIEVGRDELKQAVKELHNFLFFSWETIGNFSEFVTSLEQFLELLVKKSFLGNYPLNLKMAEKIFSIKEELKNASFSKERFSKEEMFKIFRNKLDSEIISFSGSPLKGLQILGLFETRSLNFENVIVMDVNESALPNLRIYEPLIPREVMISLGLNRLEKEEEIQRYQFRRLLASATHAYLIYQQRPDKEKSRFIEELVWEKQKESNSLEVISIPRAGFKVKVLPKRLEIKKNSKVIEFLKKREYSASSLTTYMHCPLRFYYHYVLGIREKEDLLEEPEGSDIGTFIHELFEEAFSRFLGRKPCIDVDFRKYFFSILNSKFADTFEKKMKSDSFLIKEILDFRMERFLRQESERNVSEILCLEKTFQARIALGRGEFCFKAVIDRVDKLGDGSLLVLDYKTGATDAMPEIDTEKIEGSGFKRESLKNTIKSFQLPLYLYLAEHSGKYKGAAINAALYSIKDLGLIKLFRAKEHLANKEKIMNVYFRALDSIVCDILDPDVAFKADEEDARQCTYCPFFYLCR
jgi:hypothetical protein